MPPSDSTPQANGAEAQVPSVLIRFAGPGLAELTITPSPGLEAGQLYGAAFFLAEYARAYAQAQITAGIARGPALVLPQGQVLPFRRD